MMEIKKCVAVSLAAWLVFAALVGMTAKALPNHIVGGGVFGPGNDMSSGPTNPANSVGMVFYSTSQPSYAPIAGPDEFTPANGTAPTFFARDVGSIWDWLDGDEMVTVLETTFNVGGWTGANHTTSFTTILHTGAPVQDMGDSILELFPTLTLMKGADWINASWSPLTDAGANVQSYNLYRAATPAGPFTSIATVPDTPGGKSHNDTGLSLGPVCYQLSVNYRRDNLGGLYETTGRSAMVCTTITGMPPYVVNTSPQDNAINVPVTDPIAITFSEQMDLATVTYALTPPDVTLAPAWSSGNTILTLTHTTDFTLCQSYRVDINGKDMDGNDLVPTPTILRFTVLCDKPFIISTSPADGATEVRSSSDIVITFSEAMVQGSVTSTINPTIALTSTWTAGNTVLTLAHASAFAAGTTYQVTMTGQDVDGNSLIAGQAPNPWSFTTNNPPTADIDPSDTLVGRCCSGGADLPIPWTMSDTETPTNQLQVWLSYNDGVSTVPIAGPLTGYGNTPSYLWTTPTVDQTVEIWLEVRDSAGDSAQDISATIRIDAVAPQVSSVIPADGSTSVPTDSQVVVRFSEPMQTSTVTISFTPSVVILGYTWDLPNRNVTIRHELFAVSTPYTLTVESTARDDCTPGLELGTDDTTSFTTGTGTKAPMPPTGLAVSSFTYSEVVLTWNRPMFYNDGSDLPISDIREFNVYRSETSAGPGTYIGNATGGTTTTYTDSTVQQEKTYYYWVTAVNQSGFESIYSNQASAAVPKQTTEGEFPWIWVIIVIIIILVVVGLVLLLGRKKPEEAPPEPIAGEEAPPEEKTAPEEAPAEETPPETATEGEPGKEPGGQ